MELTPEYEIAVRKAAEALNNAQVFLGEAEPGFEKRPPVGRGLGQQGLAASDRLVLEGEIFGVLQGHEEKGLLSRGKLGEIRVVQAVLTQPLGLRVGAKRRRRAPKQIARQLIQGNDKRQTGAGRGLPRVQPAVPSLSVQPGASIPDQGVRVRVGLEPKGVAFVCRLGVSDGVGKPQCQ